MIQEDLDLDYVLTKKSVGWRFYCEVDLLSFYFNFEYDSGALEAAKFYSVLGGLLFTWLNDFMQWISLSQTRFNF